MGYFQWQTVKLPEGTCFMARSPCHPAAPFAAKGLGPRSRHSANVHRPHFPADLGIYGATQNYEDSTNNNLNIDGY